MGPVLGRLFEACRRTEKRVVLLGLDNAGKTTAVYRLLLGKKIDTIPTVGFISEEIRHHQFSLILWDIGGQSRIRKLWKHYVESADALIFVVDAQDRLRMKEARVAFKRMLRHKTLKDTVILIYANKSDYEDAMTVNELIEGLDVHRVIGDRKWFIQRSCAISGQGLNEGIDWLCRTMQAKSSTPSSSSSSSGSSNGSIGFLPITPRLLGKKGRSSDPLDSSGSENDLQ